MSRRVSAILSLCVLLATSAWAQLASQTALVGTVIASALGVNDTKGIDWIELLIQVILAAVGVFAVAGLYGRNRR